LDDVGSVGSLASLPRLFLVRICKLNGKNERLSVSELAHHVGCIPGLDIAHI
jgi:hypothetical protein